MYTNRASEKQVEPTPDERQALRTLYSQSSMEKDWAVMNLWNNTDPEIKAMDNLCKPSRGLFWRTDYFDDYCSIYATTTGLCPGDELKTRFAIMNYGHYEEELTLELWFSTNDNWSTSDKNSPSIRTATVSPATSLLAKKEFTLPSTLSLNTTYYTIIRVVPVAGEESTQNNWIPLRGTIITASSCP